MVLDTDFYWYQRAQDNLKRTKNHCRYCGDFIGEVNYEDNDGLCKDCTEKIKLEEIKDID